MAKVGGTITVGQGAQGWDVLMQGPFHSVRKTLTTKDLAVEFAFEQKSGQEKREKEQTGISSIYVIYIEDEETTEAPETSPETVEVVVPDVPEPAVLDDVAVSELTEEMIEDLNKPVMVTGPVVTVEHKGGKAHISLNNTGGEPVTVWRSIDGKEGTRKLGVKKDRWAYKANPDSIISVRLDDAEGVLLFSAS